MYKCKVCGNKSDSAIFCSHCGNCIAVSGLSGDTAMLFIALLMAVLFYVFFYGVFPLPYLSMVNNYLYRIFTNHYICRIIAFLFFWGVLFSLLKLALLIKQKRLFGIIRNLDIITLLRKNLADIPKFIETLIIDAHTKNDTGIYKSSFLHSLYEITRYQSVNIESRINEHFESMYDRLESSFSIIRVFIWILPILGFMGTILGITDSIDGFTQSLSFKENSVSVEALQTESSGINQVFSSLTTVTDGLRTAFDTTFIGLFLVIPLMIFYTALKNKETQFIGEIEAFTKNCIAPVLYPAKDKARSDHDLDSLHMAIERLNDTSGKLSESIQILCLRMDRMISGLNTAEYSNTNKNTGNED